MQATWKKRVHSVCLNLDKTVSVICMRL